MFCHIQLTVIMKSVPFITARKRSLGQDNIFRSVGGEGLPPGEGVCIGGVCIGGGRSASNCCILGEIRKAARSILLDCFLIYLSPLINKVWGKVMFSQVCHVCPRDGEGVGFPACITGHMTGVGGLHPGGLGTPPPTHTQNWESGRYASYWNASLFI